MAARARSGASSAMVVVVAAVVLSLIPPAGSSDVSITSALLDAADHRSESTESAFDHMIDLLPPGDDDGPLGVGFHWNDPANGAFVGRLVHRAPSADVDAGWLGFGIYDAGERGVPESVRDLMVGSQAIIGNVKSGDVSKFALGAKKLGPGGVERMDESFQTLIPTRTSIRQHVGDDGHVTTVLTFEKIMKEADDEEIDIRGEGRNAFLYAVGPPSDGDDGGGSLGFHVLRGAFLLDFDMVSKKAKGLLPDGDEAEENGSGAAAADADVPNLCRSDDPAYLHTIRIADGLVLHYNLDVRSDSYPSPPSLTVRLAYDGLAWLGLGVSPDGGGMIGSEAVIGRPDLTLADEERPLKYRLEGKGTSAVVPLEESRQTLADASIVEADGRTVMTYTKALSEGGEIAIEPTGVVTFIYAIGNGNTLAYHRESGSFRLDLTRCESPASPAEGEGADGDGSDGTAAPKMTNRGAWATHGTVASVAWAICTPLAVTTAWFRTVVPSSWIYVHVFANVTSFFLTLVAFIIAVASMSLGGGGGGGGHTGHFSDPHHIVGLAMLMLITFQVMNGFLRPPVEKKDPYAIERERGGGLGGLLHLPDTARDLWKLAHRTAGVLLVAAGFYQISSGMDLYARDFGTASWRPYFYGYLGVFAAVALGLRLYMWYEERRARSNIDMMSPDQRQMGSLAVASGVDPNSELVPVQFDVGIQ